MSAVDESITEFEDLDPREFHLVPRGATGFPVLMAKGVDEAVDEVLNRIVGATTERNTHENIRTPRVKELEDRIAKAVESGNPDAIRTARRQLTAAKMVAAENARARGGTGYSRFGPNSVELFKNTENIGDDVALHGI